MTPPATPARARRRVAAFIVGSIVACVQVSSPASAHLLPPDLAFFGPFTADSVHCLRVISSATQRCFKRVVSLQRACADEVLAGRTCDIDGRDAQLAAATQAAQAVVATTCTGGQLTELSFSSLAEAHADVANACANQAEATRSLAYGPAASAAGSGTLSAAACMADTAAVSERLLNVSVRWRSRAFDRMATHLIPPSQKIAIMARVDAEIAAAAQALATGVGERCPTFGTLYGQDPPAFLPRLRSRGDCIVSGTYVQSKIQCPLPICGNGIKEPLEQCDDGNTISGDGCSSTCMLEGATTRRQNASP